VSAQILRRGLNEKLDGGPKGGGEKIWKGTLPLRKKPLNLGMFRDLSQKKMKKRRKQPLNGLKECEFLQMSRRIKPLPTSGAEQFKSFWRRSGHSVKQLKRDQEGLQERGEG